MRKVTVSTPSPAFVLAVIALFVALGSASYAAVELGKNDVDSRHISKGAVGTSEVQNGSIKAADLAASAAPGVESGVVDAAGTGASNPAVTVTHKGTGDYVLNFEPGTWSGKGRPLSLAVTPFGINGQVVRPVVVSGQRTANGAATFEVVLSSTQPALTPVDNAFMFIAATSG